MELIDILSLSLGTAGFIISLISIYLGRVWSNQSWMRETRLPFYLELNGFINELENDNVLWLDNQEDYFPIHINKAATLGIDEVKWHLQDLQRLISKVAGRTPSEVEMIARVQRIDGLKSFIDDDIKHLTRKRTISTILKAIVGKFWW